MPPRTKAKALNFEQATARLEEIVARVNNPETGLEEMIALVQRGSRSSAAVSSCWLKPN